MMNKHFRTGHVFFVSLLLLFVAAVIGTGVDLLAQRRIGRGGQIGRKSPDDKTPKGLRSINVNGKKRFYLLHEPSRASAIKKKPVVIMLHGGGGNGEIAQRQTGFSQKADKEGFIAVFPYGSGRGGDNLLTWNAEGCCAYAMNNSIDDVAFISRLIDTLIKDHNADKGRIYAAGHSNGAMLSLHLAREMKGKLAGVASVAGALFDTSSPPAAGVPVLLIHGEADVMVPMEGGMSGRKQIVQAQSKPYLPFADMVSFWQRHNGCDETPDVIRNGKVTTKRYMNCDDGNGVEVVVVRDGGHAWPGGKKGHPGSDTPAKELSATDAAWEFFSRHRKN